MQTSWKNGGGVTWPIASEPDDADYEFDWRISLAQVAADGPFSSFPGVDRILIVLEGAMRLTLTGQAPVSLEPNSAPHRFAGDAACAAELLAPVLGLNLMVRRDAFRGAVETVHIETETSLPLDGDAVILFVAAGDMTIITGDDVIERLGRLDAVRIDAPCPSSLALRSELGARLQILRLWRRRG